MIRPTTLLLVSLSVAFLAAERAAPAAAQQDLLMLSSLSYSGAGCSEVDTPGLRSVYVHRGNTARIRLHTAVP
jgi:hypothetical protein